MSATQASGAYLGGIGVMLEVSHPCPACGQVHEGRKFGFKHQSLRECPRVVMGSFPLVSIPSPPEALVKLAPTSRVLEPELRVGSNPFLADGPSIGRPSSETTRSRSLGVPWLPPPDLGEVF